MDTSVIRVKLDALKNETHVQIHENFIALLDKQTPAQIAEMELAPLIGLYRPAYMNEVEALELVVKSRYTPLLLEKDQDRDDSFRGFHSTIKGLCYHFDPEQQQAAKRLMDIFKHYGNIAKRPLDDETAAINDLVREFRRPDLAADIATLRVEDWLNKLIEENEKFNRLTLERFEEGAAKTAYRMKTARTVTDKYYRNIVLHLEYLLTVGRETPAVTNLIKELNLIVTHYKNILAQRAGKKNEK
jgi:hypothetical protein